MTEFILREQREKEAFESIVTLYNHEGIGVGSIFGDKIRVERGAITYLGDTYKPGNSTQTTGNMILAQMEEEGASWFGSFRGEHVLEKNKSHWEKLVSEINAAFYKKYAYLRYVEDTNNYEYGQHGQYLPKIRRILEYFFGLKNDSIHIDEDEPQMKTEEIVAIGVRMEITAGGQPVPILGKFFFSWDGKTVKPIKKQSAEAVNALLPTLPSGSGFRNDGQNRNGTIVPTVIISKIKNCLERSGFDGTEYFICNPGDKKDWDSLQNTGVANLDCIKFTIHSLIGIEQHVIGYNVCLGNQTKPHFFAKVDTLGRITIDCLACGQKMIISDSTVSFTDNNNQEREISLILSPKADSICEGEGRYPVNGENGQALLSLVQTYLKSEHLIEVSKATCCSHSGCGQRYICASNRVWVLTNTQNGQDEKEEKCKDCPYLENYTYVQEKDGPIAVSMRSNRLFFDNATKTFVLGRTPDDRNNCACCGRTISVSYDYCETCDRFQRSERRTEQHKLFRKYSYMVPILSRICFGEKLCEEDESLIVFKIGKTFYTFDKLNVELDNYLQLKKKTVRY